MSKKGLFIALEGIDGSGKTTQLRFIEKWLKDHGLPVVTTREPGGTPYAEDIREVILKKHPGRQEPMEGKTEAMLFFAARLQHVEHLIKPALAEGSFVLTDRFIGSTYAYQAAGHGISMDVIRPLAKFAIGNFRPDITFVFDIDPLVSLERAAARGDTNRLDEHPLDFYEKARESYYTQAWQEAAVDHIQTRTIFIKANESVEQVQSQLIPHLQQIINTYHAAPAR